MIADWREVWYNRTNGATDRMLPFGQVQVCPPSLLAFVHLPFYLSKIDTNRSTLIIKCLSMLINANNWQVNYRMVLQILINKNWNVKLIKTVFLQLAPNVSDPTLLNFTELRWSQTNNVGYTPNDDLPNVFTAITIDLPDFHSPNGP